MAVCDDANLEKSLPEKSDAHLCQCECSSKAATQKNIYQVTKMKNLYSTWKIVVDCKEKLWGKDGMCAQIGN